MNEQAVLVTGASTGIGRAIAVHLDELGLRVFAGVRRDEDGEALRAITSSRFTPVRLDITSADEVAAAAAVVADAVQDSRLLGIVNNAGIAVPGPLEFLTVDDYRRQFEINVIGHIQVTQAFLPMLRDSRGRVVFMSSLGGKVAQPMLSAYTASKHAIEAIGDALRIELRPWGIDVAIVEPGAVATPIWDKGLQAADALLEMAPQRLHELYGAAIDAVRAVTRHEAAAGVPPEQVAKVVEHALTAARPRTRYPVGRDARFGILAKRLLPDRIMDRLIIKAVGLPSSASETGSRVRDRGAEYSAAAR